uniref:Calponin-homology (CH) domain-containing protein n=1 Tax=Rhizochromulina marina TaxID=1034831 RepID=A0A7S2SPY0_9STRA
MVGIGPTDVVDGNFLILGLIWSILVFFIAKDLGGLADMRAIRNKILKWIKKHTAKNPDIDDVEDLAQSLADGRVLMAVLNDFNPHQCPYAPSSNPKQDLTQALDDAEKVYGVEKMIDPEDPLSTADEKFTIPYLANLMDKLHEAAPPQYGKVADDAVANVDKNPQDFVDDLVALCAIPSTPSNEEGLTAAAEKVASIMADAGVQDVAQEGSFVLGTIPGPMNAPTVLYYATYMVDDPPEPASWSSGPFIPKYSAAQRLTAQGVAEDKANVVVPLKALKNILNSMPKGNPPPCNLKVVVGGAPPAGSPAFDGDASLAPLKAFLATHQAALAPDYVIVSTPEGCAVAPGAAAAMFSCRGFLTAEVQVTTVVDAQGCDPERGVLSHRFVGPIVDPVTALSHAIASLRDKETGQLRLEGLPEFTVTSAMRETLAACDAKWPEDQVKKDSGAVDGLRLAQPLGWADVGEAPEEEDKDYLLPTVFEPGLTVTAMEAIPASSSLREPKHRQAKVAAGAKASLYLNLPPGVDPEAVFHALETTLLANLPFGASASVNMTNGKVGFLSDPGSPFFKSLAAAQHRNFTPLRAAVATGDPCYQPVACCFHELFGSSAPVYTVGVNDPEMKIGRANQSMVMEDIQASTKTFIQLLCDMPTTVMQAAGQEAHESRRRRMTSEINPVELEKRELEDEEALPPTIPAAAAAAAEGSLMKNAKQSHGGSRLFKTLASEVGAPGAAPKLAAAPEVPGGEAAPAAAAEAGKDGSGMEEAVLFELNRLRADPRAYAAVLEASIAHYNAEKVFAPPGASVLKATHEGAAAVTEAVAQLQSTAPLPLLRRHALMDQAAKAHATDLATNDTTGHVGSDGSKSSARLRRYGEWHEIAGEVIAYREGSAAAFVEQLIICDGEQRRHNRTAVLSPEFRVCGIAASEHPSLESVVVVPLAGGFGPKPLAEATVASLSAASTAEEQETFQAVLDSIPVPQLHEQVAAALEDGAEVTLDYKPGGTATATFKQPSGEANAVACDWSV